MSTFKFVQVKKVNSNEKAALADGDLNFVTLKTADEPKFYYKTPDMTSNVHFFA